jgi:hypothetical protein
MLSGPPGSATGTRENDTVGSFANHLHPDVRRKATASAIIPKVERLVIGLDISIEELQ